MTEHIVEFSVSDGKMSQCVIFALSEVQLDVTVEAFAPFRKGSAWALASQKKKNILSDGFHIHILVYAGIVLAGRIIDINIVIINYYSAIITF